MKIWSLILIEELPEKSRENGEHAQKVDSEKDHHFSA
jgi:hypothetical protein